MKKLYVNKSGEISLDLKKVLERCVFRSYCGEFSIEDKKVCYGEEGDFTNCKRWLYYTKLEMERNEPRASFPLLE